MPTKKLMFADLNRGDTFIYAGDTFIKTDRNLAWEIRAGKRYKEWAFCDDDLVRKK